MSHSNEFNEIKISPNKNPESDEQNMHLDVEEELKSTFEDIEEGKNRLTASKKKEGSDIYQTHLENFLKQFQDEPLMEGKLQMAIDFMEQSLSQGGTPHFRNFWEARRHCLPLFKENLAANIRAQLWSRYSELSKEARRLKDILDEQSAFAVEQIEIAIHALEQEIEKGVGDKKKGGIDASMVFPHVLKGKRSFYEDIQSQLNQLNAHASRINALRKELLKTEMRVKHKNKFFQRLSLAGDKVFPLRKELIKQISQQFTEDVNGFIETHFKSQLNHESGLYVLREEIKVLQGLAKILTLNTNAFTQTRMRLSECWDQVKVKEKEKKKERAKQKVVFKQNAEQVHQMIETFKQQMEKENLSLQDANKKMDEIVSFMRKTELGRDELQALREELNEARKPLQTRLKEEENLKFEQEQERSRQKKEKYLSLKERADSLTHKHEEYEAETLISKRDELLSDITGAGISKSEKQELERLLKPLKDLITDKREKALLSLSDDDKENLKQLREILEQRKSRRQDIKNQLELHRKALGSSNLDFEKAMILNELVAEEKERLEKINQGVKEIEEKIAHVQSKIK